MSPETHAVVDRLAKLERTNRLLAALLVVLVVLVATVAATNEKIGVVRGSTFHLVDDAGEVRAEIGLRDGSVGLFLSDENGKERLRVSHDDESSAIYIKDETGTTRIGVAQFAHGGGGFALHGPQSKGAAVLYLKGKGSLRFFDDAGNVTNTVSATPHQP